MSFKYSPDNMGSSFNRVSSRQTVPVPPPEIIVETDDTAGFPDNEEITKVSQVSARIAEVMLTDTGWTAKEAMLEEAARKKHNGWVPWPAFKKKLEEK
jgi:hypothetical protein